jgi:CheY-like chemotaxis protein
VIDYLKDVSMPVMDGFTATREIRAYEKANNLAAATVVALTGLGSSKAQREAFASGVNLFLTKPVPLKKLKALIEDDAAMDDP